MHWLSHTTFNTSRHAVYTAQYTVGRLEHNHSLFSISRVVIMAGNLSSLPSLLCSSVLLTQIYRSSTSNKSSTFKVIFSVTNKQQVSFTSDECNHYMVKTEQPTHIPECAKIRTNCSCLFCFGLDSSWPNETASSLCISWIFDVWSDLSSFFCGLWSLAFKPHDATKKSLESRCRNEQGHAFVWECVKCHDLNSCVNI